VIVTAIVRASGYQRAAKTGHIGRHFLSSPATGLQGLWMANSMDDSSLMAVGIAVATSLNMRAARWRKKT